MTKDITVLNKSIEKPLISVVIATYKRRDVLKVTLEKLCIQTMAPDKFEVLVIDDGSHDGTAEMTESMILSAHYRLRYFGHENRGPGYTQNRGIKEAQSELVLLIADDIWATQELLEQHLKVHLEHQEENIAVLGNVVQSPELPPTIMHKYWDPFQFSKFRWMREVPCIYFYACNISIKKDFLLKNCMFRERKGAAHEDAELGYRLGQAGLHILHNEQALAYHFHEENLDGACRRAYERGLNFDMLSENIPKSYIFPLYKIATIEAGAKAYIKMLPREIVRKCLFNRWSVRVFWLPILRRDENSFIASVFAGSLAYRGTVSHYLREGYKDLRKKTAATRRTD